MQNETLARRYAQAVFSLASDANEVERVGGELAAIASGVRNEEAVRAFYVSPVIDRASKERALMAAFGGKTGEIALHTLLLLVRKRRESLLDALVAEYRKLELAARGAEPIVVSTARELPQPELRSLIERLERIYGKRFEASVKLDPALIGGVRIAMGDRVIDGSIAGRLEELTRTLFGSN
ncbi:MAG TPA: ATP synthase F1 subunit delta [Candidatus Acidoferrales bacterium]|nr:ATP synthase F1 subunit delta [Candidatus Acidoferrales bacterium]